MKKLLSLFCFWALFTSVYACNLLDPSILSRNELLRYSIAMEGGDAAFQEQFMRDFMEAVTPYPHHFYSLPEEDKHPDIRVSFTAMSDEKVTMRANLSSLSPQEMVFTHKSKRCAQELAKSLKRYYFKGMVPTYSTIFRNGEGGYVEFRIPAVTTLPDGVIVAFAEARAAHKDCAENDMVAKISRDRGRTWGELIVVAQSGAKSLNNPVVLLA